MASQLTQHFCLQNIFFAHVFWRDTLAFDIIRLCAYSDCHLGDTHTTRRARLTSKRRITTVTKRVSVKPLEGVLSGGKLSFMQDGCSWPVHVKILRHRYVGSHTTLCLYHGGCGSTTPLNLQSTTPPLEPQPRLNHPNPAATPQLNLLIAII